MVPQVHVTCKSLGPTGRIEIEKGAFGALLTVVKYNYKPSMKHE
jgi:hypothetical protein